MIPECKNIIHPFQNDPGTSQQQRVAEELLSGAAKIDNRSMADLLDFFVQLSKNVNYYDENLQVSDWQPFFAKSLPFVLSSIIKYDRTAAGQKLTAYKARFDSKPSAGGLYLLLRYTFTNIIKKINSWDLQVANSGIPLETVMDKLMKDKLSGPLKNFIKYSNAATHWYGTKAIRFNFLPDNPSWNLVQGDLYNEDTTFRKEGNTKRKRLMALYNKVYQLVQTFHDVIRLLSVSATQSLDQSLLPLKEELKEKHPPHLAILFAFIKLFQYLQGDLNGYTKKHLDFFYKQVLQLKPKGAEPDKVHLVLDIQTQLDKYLFKKGLLFKDGKDNNKADIIFSSDDEIVVNKAQVADQRTLFINNLPVKVNNVPKQTCDPRNVAEGVYIAPDATKANGIDKDFKDGLPSRATLGDKWSKYIDPENKFVYPYPNARLGFILASPVLLLNEGTRTITITLSCQLQNGFCDSLVPIVGSANPCCDNDNLGGGGSIPKPASNCTPNFPSGDLVSKVSAAMNETYYYISQSLIAALVKKGISKDLKEKLLNLLLIRHSHVKHIKGEVVEIIDPNVCFCPWDEKFFEITLANDDFKKAITDPSDRELIKEFIYPRKALSVLFSGEKDWIKPLAPTNIAPSENLTIHINNYNSVTGNFTLELDAVILPEQKAITFYNADSLKEDFNTTLPLVKIELDDKIKIEVPVNDCNQDDTDCCDRVLKGINREVSLYHFFREVKVRTDSKIEVQVCGLKNVIVQNEESLQDVNSPIYPFGTRPDIIDFSVVNAVACITQTFINDAVTAGLSVGGSNYLQSLLTAANDFRKTVSKNSIEAFLNTKDSSNNPVFTGGDKTILRTLLQSDTKKYCQSNDSGSSFYLGSKEVFCKSWNSVRINLNWKDKPSDFREYYNAYVVEDVQQQIFGLDENKFKIRLSALQKGTWTDEANDRKLFDVVPPPAIPPLVPMGTSPCIPDGAYKQGILLKSTDFAGFSNRPFNIVNLKDSKLTVDTRDGFIRINLRGQDFLHKDYAYVLARQMMALGKYPDQLLEGAVYRKDGSTVIVFRNFGNIIHILEASIAQMNNQADAARIMANNLYNAFNSDANYTPLPAPVFPVASPVPPPPLGDSIDDSERDDLYYKIYNTLTEAIKTLDNAQDVLNNYDILKEIYSLLDPILGTKVVEPLEVLIPNEPWTPIISNISLDYTATATSADIDLIQLYPYTGTYKAEEIQQEPMLFPTFCDEGNFFIGLQNLVPGSNVNILFQLAEATADSESERESLVWYYLQNNEWKLLRTGFEVLNDDTDGLTTSGIIKFSLPANMTNENSILPKGLHWIRASIPCKSKSVAEIIGIHTQAVKATFTNDDANDKLRLDHPLEAGSVAKLKVADASVKKIAQPYESFGGQIPEEEGHYYIRVSELLRHKNRAIQKFDYERLVLEAFPKIFKTKCINHTYALDAGSYINDFPIAPGYVLIAVIPDLNQLKAAQSFEPKVPVSLLEQVEAYLKKITSPFVRLKIMNPRYEKVNFCIRVILLPGKDEVYYKEQLALDIKTFLAPWAIGEYEKLAFGQSVSRSDMIRFLESRDYINYIIDFRMIHEDKNADINGLSGNVQEILPISARSILVAGAVDVCIDQPGCEQWCLCGDVAGNINNQPCCDHPAIPIREDLIEVIN